MQSSATSPQEYIDSLPEDRKAIIAKLRKVILKNLPKGFEEQMSYGMLGYVVPHKVYPKGYHVNPALPLPFINLASQKNHIAFYHSGLYAGLHMDWFLKEWPKHSSKKLDMGKSCIRFKKAEDVTVELLGELCSKITPQEWIATYEENLNRK
jgi:hypothetical protein